MNKLLKLFSILQLTKEQKLTGYLTTGIRYHELPSLAEHQYTTTIMAWFLVQKIKKAGGLINERKMTIMLLIHDLGKLFGGDITCQLNNQYPDLKEYKDRIGERTMLILSSFMDDETSDSIERLWLEFESEATDEAIVAKICDQMDHHLFIEHLKQKDSSGTKENFYQDQIYLLTKKIQDKKTKEIIILFLEEFKNNFYKKGAQTTEFLIKP